MTFKQVGEYVEQQIIKDEENMKIEASIQYRIGQMLIGVFGVKKPKLLTYDELFPELKMRATTNVEEAIVLKWQEFLGVVR